MKNILIVILSLSNSFVFAQKNNIAGKIYRSKVTLSCAETTTGGYMKYEYEDYNFGKDSVTVFHYSKKSNQDKEEFFINKFKYSAENEYIIIIPDKRYFTYTKFKMLPDVLIVQETYPEQILVTIINPATKPEGY